MTLLEQVQGWVGTYPGMERLERFWVEDVGTGPGQGGLYPKGLTELERKEDILGNVEVVDQVRFRLYFVFQKAASDAHWLLDFQDWVQEQSATGALPPFGGDGGTGQTARAERGMLCRVGEDGTATYSVTLTIKYKKRYEV